MSELVKGAAIPLTQENPDLSSITVGVQFTATEASFAQELLLGAMLCDKQGRLLSDTDLVFFNQLTDSSHSVEMGDDVQQLDIALTQVPQNVEKIDVVLWVNRSTRSLDKLRDLKIRVLDTETSRMIGQSVSLVPDSPLRAIALVQVYRHRGEWKVRVKGEGWESGVEQMLKAYR